MSSEDNSGSPLVVMLIGLPGAGKSAVAEALVKRCGLHRVCRDLIRRALFPDCAYTPTEKRAAFRAVMLATEVNLALGRHCVIDGMTFSRRRDRRRVQALAERYGARVLRLWLDVSPDLARQRVAQDVADGHHLAADRTPHLVDEVLARFEKPQPPIVVIDASADAAVVEEQALTAVRTQLAHAR
jgi:predicted kinase